MMHGQKNIKLCTFLCYFYYLGQSTICTHNRRRNIK